MSPDARHGVITDPDHCQSCRDWMEGRTDTPMTPEIASQLADHHARIEAMEGAVDKVESGLNRILWALIGGQSALLLAVVGLLLKGKA